ncbi:hypothetical protein L0F63_001057 [Massospora cicadina]|nr:hypothetical protein L0F63_001057 [Massospora cicadina]
MAEREKLTHRQKERQIASLNKRAIDSNQAWQDLTLLVAPQWAADVKVGQALFALCEQDGAKVVADPRMTIPFSLCWELKTSKRYDKDQAMFVPLPVPVYVPVRKILLKWEAAELLEWYLAKKGSLDRVGLTLAGHHPAEASDLNSSKFDLQLVKLSYPNYQIISVVTGTQALFRTIRSQVNRQFNHQVRALDGEAGPNLRAPRSSAPARYELGQIDQFEDYLIQLQVVHGVHAVQFETPAEATDFIHAINREISQLSHHPQTTRPSLNLPELATRKSDCAAATWKLILEQIYLVTPTVASAIAGRVAVLSGIEVVPPKGRPKRLGENLAARIVKAFTSRDPELPKVAAGFFLV